MPLSPDLHCSHGSDGSWTDPVTNWTLISGVKLDRDLAGMLQIGQFPASLFGPFVHELVHHWCFHSPVGAALTHLHLRLRRNACLIDAEPDAKDRCSIFNVLEDLVRYEAAISIMRPLAEGLALFSEFDLMPASGMASSASIPAAWIVSAFRNPNDEIAELDWDDYFARILAYHRQSNVCEQRKANLLADRFDCRDGGYLPGYLLVKSLWYKLAFENGCSSLQDKDLFLSYVRSFFYEDYGLVAAVLDNDGDETDTIKRVHAYGLDRLVALRETTESDVRQFEQYLAGRKPGDAMSLGECLPLRTPPALIVTGIDRLDRLMAEIRGIGDPASLEDWLKQQDQWTFAQRDLMCIGSFRETMHVNARGRIAIGNAADESFVFNVPALPGVGPCVGEGLVAFFISPTGMYRYMVVSMDARVIALFPLTKDFPKELLAQVKDYQPDADVAMQQKRTINALVGELLEKDGLDTLLAHYRNQFVRIRNAFYDGRSLSRTPDHMVDACAATMRDSGLYPILANDGQMLRNLAFATLVCSIELDAGYVNSALGKRGISLEQLLLACAAATEKHGIPLLERHEDLIISYV
jgi:hypothetical protein